MRYLIVLVMCVVGCGNALAAMEEAQYEEAPPVQLTVLAEESLSITLPSIARQYTLKNHISLNLSFDSTAHQVAKIEEGEPADVFITTSEDTIKQLKMQGLLDAYTYISVAGNRMMLAVAASNPLRFTMKETQGNLFDYLPDGKKPLFAVVNSDLHAEGQVVADVLKALRLDTAGDAMLPLPLTTIAPASVTILPEKRAVIDMVARGNTYGILYATEARHFTAIRQAALLPESMHRPVRYIAVVVAGTQMDAARKFAEFLRTPEAQAIFEEHGFIPAIAE